MKLLNILIGSFFLLSSCSNSTQYQEVIRLSAEGTPEELRSEIVAESIENISTIRFGRNYSLIHIAIGNQSYPEVIRVLHDFGADLNAQDDDLRTPLDYAVDNDNAESARILLELGADPLSKNIAEVNVIESCKNVVLRDFPNHNTCNVILSLAGKQ